MSEDMTFTVEDETPKRPHRSYSQYSSFLRCGEAYRLERIVKVPVVPSVYLEGGSAYHSAIEEYEQRRFGGQTMTVAEAIEVYQADFIRRVEEQRAKFPDVQEWRKAGRATKANPNKEDIDVWYSDLGPEMVRNYVQYAQANPGFLPATMPDGEPGIEVPFEIEFEDTLVKGYIDQVIKTPRGELLVRDLKTGSREPDSTTQLGLYRVALNEVYGLDITYGDYFMARKGGPSQVTDLSTYTRATLTRMFTAMDTAVKAELFMPNPGQFCRTCPVRDYCFAVGGAKAGEVAPK